MWAEAVRCARSKADNPTFGYQERDFAITRGEIFRAIVEQSPKACKKRTGDGWATGGESSGLWRWHGSHDVGLALALRQGGRMISLVGLMAIATSTVTAQRS
jgi:hypothetical protein